MELNFELNFEDWVQFQTYYLKTSKTFKTRKLIVTIFFPAMMMALSIIDITKNGFRPPIILLFLSLSILWIWLYPKRILNAALGYSKKTVREKGFNNLWGNYRLLISNEDIHSIGPNGEYKIKWSTFCKFYEDRDYLFLFNTPISAIIIPKKKVDHPFVLEQLIIQINNTKLD